MGRSHAGAEGRDADAVSLQGRGPGIQNPTLANYQALLGPKGFLIPIRNSLLVSSAVTLISVVIASLAAYSMVRFRYRFRGDRVYLVGRRPAASVNRNRSRISPTRRWRSRRGRRSAANSRFWRKVICGNSA